MSGARILPPRSHLCLDTDDPSVGLINGELAIPGNLLRREVFDPVVNQVRNQCTHVGQ